MAKKDEKFYWLKLDKGFFKRPDIKIIEAMENGKDYILFYLKLLCESIDKEGLLRLTDTIPYNESMLSSITNTNVDVVRSAVKVFIQLNMLEKLDNGTLYMTELQQIMGSKTYWAERKEIQKQQKLIEIKENIEEKEKNVGKVPTEVQQTSNSSISISLSNSISKSSSFSNIDIIKEIIDYLNIKANREYKHTTKANQTVIKARLNEKFTLDDFKKVIDNKVASWLGTKEFDMYLRPSTLFGTKFESYLNEKPKQEKPKEPTIKLGYSC